MRIRAETYENGAKHDIAIVMLIYEIRLGSHVRQKLEPSEGNAPSFQSYQDRVLTFELTGLLLLFTKYFEQNWFAQIWA